ncbi:MAG: hypothetical protein NZ651_04865 [Candidatus Bipolaricaulota bacterium]|nr:hypothetical protein [Candidatus Bipolaricaulota bacterium]MDW8127085.1 hypothetical protein [Candidatus Bipolaricaulota bacterium]
MIIFVFFLFTVLGAGGVVGVVVGWAGRAVVSVVNPVWVSLTNPAPSPFSGELRLSGKIGSPWRGEAQRTMVFPVFLAPFGRTRVVVPWPVELGSSALKVELFSGGNPVFSQEISLDLELGRLRGAVGPPTGLVDVLLSSSELPLDPLLLWPFSQLDLSTEISEKMRFVLQAWAMFLEGKSSLSVPWALAFQGEPLRQRLQGYRASPPLWIVLAPGLFVYLSTLGFVLSRYSRGDARLLAVFLAVFLGFSLFYAALRSGSFPLLSVNVQIVSCGLLQFSLELWGGVSWREEVWRLRGFWVELLPERGWEGLDLEWGYSEEGWETKFVLTPGRPRVFFRLAEGVGSSGDGESVPPPEWLRRAIQVPWEQAHVLHTVTMQNGRKTEIFCVLLP